MDLLSFNDEDLIDGYSRSENISDEILEIYRKKYDKRISREDIFYYIYGVLHSPEYKKRFSSDLSKRLPRIPFLKEFWLFSKAGQDLASWHLNYETVEPYPLIQDGEIDLGDSKLYEITKMYFPKTSGKEDKTTIVYNNRIKLGGIPLETYDYQVNGKSAIDWLIERYQVSIDTDSQIKNDPNDWCREADDPEYILNLIKRLVKVSVESVKIIKSLPQLDEIA